MNITIAGLLIIVALSAIIGSGLAFRKPVDKPVKVMLFVLYFWLAAFIQLALIALAYWANGSSFQF